MTKTVLITGCSSGIGRITAEIFHRKGWRVYATARNPDDVSELAEKGMATPALDVTDDGQVREVADEMIEEEGRVDVLVNNAGYGQMGAIEDVPVERVEHQFDVNVYGPHRLTRAVLPQMREQGDGTVVNISSVAGQLSAPGMGVYSGSKHALEAMTDALRAEVDGFGIDAVLVEPGPVKTSFNERADSELEGLETTDVYEDLYEAVEEFEEDAENRLGVGPEKVARTIYKAASAKDPKARYTVTLSFRMMRLGRNVPAKWRDRVYRRME